MTSCDGCCGLLCPHDEESHHFYQTASQATLCNHNPEMKHWTTADPDIRLETKQCLWTFYYDTLHVFTKYKYFSVNWELSSSIKNWYFPYNFSFKTQFWLWLLSLNFAPWNFPVSSQVTIRVQKQNLPDLGRTPWYSCLGEAPPKNDGIQPQYSIFAPFFAVKRFFLSF